MKFKCRLRVILAEKEMRQGELCEVAKVSRPALSSLVNNNSLPSFEVAYRIAEALDMRIEEIWRKEGE
jgi:putative transcriptional regulator